MEKIMKTKQVIKEYTLEWEEWENVCYDFIDYYSQDIFNQWIECCHFETVIDNIAIINAPTRLIKERIDIAYKEPLRQLWKRLNSNIEDIKITIGKSKLVIKQKPSDTTAEIIQLPLWKEQARGTPNAALRGALFSAINPNKRRFLLRREMITDEKDLQIIFTGGQLDQSDRDVWELLLHIARRQPLGNHILFSANSFLKELGRGTGKSQHEWLKDCFARLIACCIEITHNQYTYAGNLLEYERDENTQRYKLFINPKMKALYMAGWTQIDYSERLKIGNKKFLALWLYGFIASHAKIYPTKIETFHRLSGSANSEMRGFKRNLKNALQHLKDINLIKEFHFKDNLVHIEKYPSKSQIKYLNKEK
jgi:hypothetical protein